MLRIFILIAQEQENPNREDDAHKASPTSRIRRLIIQNCSRGSPIDFRVCWFAMTGIDSSALQHGYLIMVSVSVLTAPNFGLVRLPSHINTGNLLSAMQQRWMRVDCASTSAVYFYSVFATLFPNFFINSGLDEVYYETAAVVGYLDF